MSRIFKDLHLGLLQRAPVRDSGEPSPLRRPADPLEARAGGAASRSRAGSKLGVALTLLAIPSLLWVARGKEALLVRMGYESVAPLPEPSAALSLDDQALYWTFALYDFAALERRYQVRGYFAIDGERARKRLDRLLPHVSPGVIGEISGFTHVAFHAVPRPRLRP